MLTNIKEQPVVTGSFPEKAKCRVCYVCESWESGGIEAFITNVLTQMDLTKFEFDIVVAEMRESVFTLRLEKVGIHFLELSGSQKKIWRNYNSFKKLLRERQYSIVHVHAFHALSLYYVHLARKAGVPVRIAHSHNTLLGSSRLRPLKQMIHRWSRYAYTSDATELWACSRMAMEFLFSDRGIKEMPNHIIFNGIDTEVFRFDSQVRDRIRAQMGITDKFVIGNVGRLCEQKNQSFVLQIFAEICKSNSESYLLLIGKGKDEDMLRQEALQLGISKKVRFCGDVSDVASLLCAMDIFLFPSLFEGLGIAAIEAQAAGLPTICSERVPEEANITDLFHRVSLAATIQDWANAIRIQKNRVVDRYGYSEMVKRKGFDNHVVTEQISQMYLTGIFNAI